MYNPQITVMVQVTEDGVHCGAGVNLPIITVANNLEELEERLRKHARIHLDFWNKVLESEEPFAFYKVEDLNQPFLMTAESKMNL